MNYYANAIDIIHSGKIDDGDLVIAILKQNPAAIVKAAASLEIEPDPLLREVKELAGKDKTGAIKKLRNETGIGLKEALETVNELMKP